jgi:hypothetical protein
MKPKGLYVFTASDMHAGFFHSKLFVAALILALLSAFLPAASVFAAPASRQGITEDNDLEQEWSSKRDQMWGHNIFYASVRLNPADFKNSSDLALAQYYLDKYKAAWKQANTIIFNHAGFDINGRVLDVKAADQSVRDLALYLHMMRGLREKFDEVTP